jgi:hypothetical protein
LFWEDIGLGELISQGSHERVGDARARTSGTALSADLLKERLLSVTIQHYSQWAAIITKESTT